MKVGEAFVEVRPDTGNFQQEADRKLGGALKGIAKGAAAVYGAKLAKDFFSGAVEEAQEAAKVTAQTEAAIKSMGNVAGISASQVADLAESISNKTAIDDEAIQSASNLLLTFGKVRNEVGDGNDIFNQATQAAVDMSVALGTDAKGAAIQIGKALNDPIKGITALSRAGVSFTEQQKEQIKTMVASGDTLGAQKLIMSELTKQFGGSAAAAATPMDKLKVTFANFQETLGTALLPVINQVVGALSKFLPVVAPFLPVLVPLAAAITAIVVATRIWTAVQTALNVILAANPIGLIILAIAALVAGIIIAYKNSETFRNVVQAAWDVLKGVASFVGGAVVAAFGAMSTAVSAVVGFIQRNWPLLLAILTGPIGLAVKFIRDHFDGIVSFVSGLPGRIGRAASGMWDGIKTAFKSAVNAIIRGWNGIQFRIPGFKIGPIGYDGFTLGVPDIPLLHSGGVFRAPLGQREGLALLEDGERVIPRGGAGGMGPITVELVVDGQRFTAAIVDPMAEQLRRRDAGLR